MGGYILTWKDRATDQVQACDGSVLRPDTLYKLDRQQLSVVEIQVGRAKVPLSELFDVEAVPASSLTLRALPPLNCLGAQMASGELVIEGDAGDMLGASMTGGLIRVTGSAGDTVGGPDFTSTRGMTGGEILIQGGAGDFVGLKMRRGLIAVAGATGKSPGYHMLAGTIVLGQGPFDYPGLEMRRGTILILDSQAQLALGESFTQGGVVDASAIPAVSIVRKRLDRLGLAINGNTEGGEVSATTAGRYRIFCGDRFELNKGEILQWLW